MTTRFQLTIAPQRIIFGAGELDNLGDHLSQRRVLLCTSPTYSRNGTANRVREALGDRLADSFEEVEPHVPAATVDVSASRAEQLEVDAVIGLGGGSAIDTSKAVSVALHRRQQDRSRAAVIGIPATYAGSEMTPFYGVTSEAEGRKVAAMDPHVIPHLVLYDPELTLDLPPQLSASTGMNALAHCVECVYSDGRTPLATATGLAGIGAIVRALPRCVRNGQDLEARKEMLIGAYLAGATATHARIALHHAICHTLGGTAGVPHGVANSIMLPHVARFNLPAAVSQFAAIGRAMELSAPDPSDAAIGEAAVEAIADLVRTLGMPQRLRDVGVEEDALPHLANLTFKSPAIGANPSPIDNGAQIEAVLREAY